MGVMRLVREVLKDVCPECERADDHWGYDPDLCTHKPTERRVVLVPGCCDASTKVMLPLVSVDFPDDDDAGQDQWTAKWSIPYGEYHYHRREDMAGEGRFYLKDDPFPTHCPFCGTTLPEIVLAEDPPSPITDRNYDGHCSCGWPRSFGLCECWPRIAMYDVKEPDEEVISEEEAMRLVRAVMDESNFREDLRKSVRAGIESSPLPGVVGAMTELLDVIHKGAEKLKKQKAERES